MDVKKWCKCNYGSLSKAAQPFISSCVGSAVGPLERPALLQTLLVTLLVIGGFNLWFGLLLTGVSEGIRLVVSLLAEATPLG